MEHQDHAYLRDGLGLLTACDAMLFGRSAYQIFAKLYQGGRGYGAKPATYVICQRDAALSPDMAEAMAALAQAATVSLDADHLVGGSDPASLHLAACWRSVKSPTD